jgi:uncharacterized membrane protein
MTVPVAKHEYFHVHPFEYFTRFSKYPILSFIVGMVVFIIALLFASTILSALFTFIKLLSG